MNDRGVFADRLEAFAVRVYSSDSAAVVLK
jgi:hypothetical protein